MMSKESDKLETETLIFAVVITVICLFFIALAVVSEVASNASVAMDEGSVSVYRKESNHD